MSVNEVCRTVVLFGATARLAPAIATEFTARGFEVLTTTRKSTGGDVCGVDLGDPRTWKPAFWHDRLPIQSVTAVVSLVSDGHDAMSGVGAVYAMAAVEESAAAPVTAIHLGSVAEAQRAPRSTYGEAKRQARVAAVQSGRCCVLTLAVVPRNVGHRADRDLRRGCRLSPALACLPIAVTPAKRATAAIAYLVESAISCGELVVGSRLESLGYVVNAPRPWMRLSAQQAAFVLPRNSRVRRMTQIASGAFTNHYLSAAVPSSEAPTTIGGDFSVSPRHSDDDLGDRWLIPTPAQLFREEDGHA